MNKSAMNSLALLACSVMILAGCTTSRIGALQTQPQPAPLNPAPAGSVTSSQLPPPAQPVNASQFPDAPQSLPSELPVQSDVATDVADATEVETPTTETSIQQVASAAPVTKEALVGAWQVSTAGSSCQMFMALTQWTGGYRAASRGCPGDAASVSAWNVSGQQVVLSDSSGNKVATLFSSGNNRFDGQTTSGRAISLSR